ncbi:tyrosine-type recombinase/integrase [Deinococcus sp. PESE-13]
MPKKAKRGNGRGTVYFEKKNGKWRWQYVFETERMSGYCLTKTQAERELAKVVADRERGLIKRPDHQLLGAAVDEWLESRRRELKPKTLAGYEHLINKHLKPRLGGTKLQDLTVRDVARFQEALEDDGYATSTIKHLRVILNGTLDRAVMHEVLVRNPMDKLTFKGKPGETREVWTPEQAAAFVQATRRDYQAAPLVFALMTGMRRGEVLGLKWDDIDFTKGTLRINRSLVTVNGAATISTPKTENSKRLLSLSPDTVAFLKEHWDRQANLALSRGGDWVETGYAFTNASGEAWHPDSLRITMHKACRKAGIPVITIHGIRHTHTSLMARRGIPVEVISKRLGHAKISTTMDVYRHLYEDELQNGAVDLLELTA